MLKLRTATLLMTLSRWLHQLSDLLSDQAMLLVSDGFQLEEEVTLAICNLYFLVKEYDKKYIYQGIIARDDEDARKQAWKLPGSLRMLKSIDQLQLEIAWNASQRKTHERAE